MGRPGARANAGGRAGCLAEGDSAQGGGGGVLKEHYRDMQDIEFTVEEGTLYLLQTRTAKRTAPAALKAAVDMVDEGLISREEAIARIEPGQLEQLLHPMLDPDADYE